MLSRYATMFIAVTSSLSDILFIRVNFGERVRIICGRRSEICEKLPAIPDCKLVICSLMTSRILRRVC